MVSGATRTMLRSSILGFSAQVLFFEGRFTAKSTPSTAALAVPMIAPATRIRDLSKSDAYRCCFRRRRSMFVALRLIASP
jgi:hypothetical protein